MPRPLPWPWLESVQNQPDHFETRRRAANCMPMAQVCPAQAQRRMRSCEGNSKESDPKPDLSQCGVLGHSQDDGSRIMHGTSAARCTWRWQVSLHDVRKNTTKSSHFCGGTLIDGKWVLTAAHCVGSFSQCDLRFVRVIAGAWKHSSESRLREGTSAERGVVRVHKHPRLDSCILGQATATDVTDRNQYSSSATVPFKTSEALQHP